MSILCNSVVRMHSLIHGSNLEKQWQSDEHSSTTVPWKLTSLHLLSSKIFRLSISKLVPYKHSPSSNTLKLIKKASTTRTLYIYYKANSQMSPSTSKMFSRPGPRTSRHRDQEQRTSSPLCRNILSHLSNNPPRPSTEHPLAIRLHPAVKIPFHSTLSATSSC